MPHEIEPFEDYIAGESVTWEYTLEEGGNPKDLTGVSVEWYLFDREGQDVTDAVLSSVDDGGVTAEVVSTADGRVDVTIDQDVTADLGGGIYHQRLVADGADGTKEKWVGKFPIQND